MESILSVIDSFNWELIADEMNEKGFSLVRGLLTSEQADMLKHGYTDPVAFRKTIQMERYRFGMGENKYFSYPLPPILQSIREKVYEKLVPIANSWMEVLKSDTHYPGTLRELLLLCEAHGQVHPTVLMLKYEKGGHNTLHQDLYGQISFPLQVVLFLNTPVEEYTGGEFVLLQQTPRAQSKAMVLQPQKGDMLVFTTHSKPVKGSKGYYRVNIKHGVSEVHEGERYTLGIIFHDALS